MCSRERPSMQEAQWTAGRVRLSSGRRSHVSGMLIREATVRPEGLSGSREVHGLDLQNTEEGNEQPPI